MYPQGSNKDSTAGNDISRELAECGRALPMTVVNEHARKVTKVGVNRTAL
jgi:hypothetical protein